MPPSPRHPPREGRMERASLTMPGLSWAVLGAAPQPSEPDPVHCSPVACSDLAQERLHRSMDGCCREVGATRVPSPFQSSCMGCRAAVHRTPPPDRRISLCLADMGSFEDSEERQSVSHGEAAVIRAPHIASFPQPQVTWFRDGRKIPPSSRM